MSFQIFQNATPRVVPLSIGKGSYFKYSASKIEQSGHSLRARASAGPSLFVASHLCRFCRQNPWRVSAAWLRLLSPGWGSRRMAQVPIHWIRFLSLASASRLAGCRPCLASALQACLLRFDYGLACGARCMHWHVHVSARCATLPRFLAALIGMSPPSCCR